MIIKAVSRTDRPLDLTHLDKLQFLSKGTVLKANIKQFMFQLNIKESMIIIKVKINQNMAKLW